MSALLVVLLMLLLYQAAQLRWAAVALIRCPHQVPPPPLAAPPAGP